jgi:enolase
MPIQKIHARQVYDSRGQPTVEVDISPYIPLIHAVLRPPG